MIVWLIDSLIDWLINKLEKLSWVQTSQYLIMWLIDWLIDGLIYWQADEAKLGTYESVFNQMIDWLTDWLIDWQAGEAKLGTDESVFNQVFCTRSFPQLRATFERYRALTGKGILDTIKREMSGDVRDGFLAIGTDWTLYFLLCCQ